MTRSGLTPRQVTIFAIIAAAGILARCVSMGRSYWFDELATLINVDVDSLLTVLIDTAKDKQPPLYNSAAFFWVKAFGPGEIALRSLSLIFGLLALATPWVARSALTRSEKILSFTLLCVMVLPIKYAQEARNYSLLLLFSSVCLFAYYELLTRPTARLRACFYIALGLLALSHLFGLLLAVSYLAVIFLRPRSGYERLGAAVFAMVITAVVLVPLLLGGAAQAAGGNFWLKLTPRSLAWALLMVFTPVGLVMLAYAAARWRRGPDSIKFDALLTQAAAPSVLMFLGALLISFHTPLINERNLIGVIPALVLVIVRLLQRAIARDGAAPAIILTCLLLLQPALLVYLGKLFIREDFREIARQSIAANARVCYVVPDGDAVSWRSIMAFYVSRLFHRSDLEPLTFARSDLGTARLTAHCRLWAEAHPEGRESDLSSLPSFRGCAPVALRTGRAQSTSVLLSCPE